MASQSYVPEIKAGSAMLLAFCLTACVNIPTAEDQLASLKVGTGLEPVQIANGTAPYLGKTHRGYGMLLRIQAGNVWGRYATRIAIGETGRELGGIWSFLSGSYKTGGNMTGSPLDRLLSRVIGQPISMVAILTHNKPQTTRVDVITGYAPVKPEDPLPQIVNLGFLKGYIGAADPAIARKLGDNANLVKRLRQYRSFYIRAESGTVTFMFAGSENEYSSMIRESGGYDNLLNSIMDSLADIAVNL